MPGNSGRRSKSCVKAVGVATLPAAQRQEMNGRTRQEVRQSEMMRVTPTLVTPATMKLVTGTHMNPPSASNRCSQTRIILPFLRLHQYFHQGGMPILLMVKANGSGTG